jgi:hypothetical protein
MSWPFLLYNKRVIARYEAISLLYRAKWLSLSYSAQLPLGCYFVLIQSNQKSSQQKCFFALKASALQIRQNQGCKQLPHLVRTGPCFSKYLLCPAAAQATIVLPDFARSLSADGEKIEVLKSYRICFGTPQTKPFSVFV